MADDAELIKAAAEGTVGGIIKPFAGLVTALLGPATTEAGLFLRDKIRLYKIPDSVLNICSPANVCAADHAAP